MIINTKYFGEVEIDEKKILYFDEGIPGIDGYKRYVVINEDLSDSPIYWLQSVDEEYISLPIINPFEVKPNYEFDIDKNTVECLELKNPSDVSVYSIVVVPEGDVLKMTANLKAPIIINSSNNKARQMIMDNSPYEIKHYIMEEMLKEKAAEAEGGK